MQNQSVDYEDESYSAMGAIKNQHEELESLS